MTLIEATKDSFRFQLAKWEKPLLFSVLKRYPCIPPTHHTPGQAANHPKLRPSHRLLEEALAEQRAENQNQLRAFLADSQRLQENQAGWLLSLAPAEVEWLLQILNDVRVGSWIRLGSPEERPDTLPLNAAIASDFWMLEMADLFQMALLDALGGDKGART